MIHYQRQDSRYSPFHKQDIRIRITTVNFYCHEMFQIQISNRLARLKSFRINISQIQCFTLLWIHVVVYHTCEQLPLLGKYGLGEEAAHLQHHSLVSTTCHLAHQLVSTTCHPAHQQPGQPGTGLFSGQKVDSQGANRKVGSSSHLSRLYHHVLISQHIVTNDGRVTVFPIPDQPHLFTHTDPDTAGQKIANKPILV